MDGYSFLVQKYARYSRRYDRRWNLFSGNATLRAAEEAVPWAAVERVLDVGCGTGMLEESALARRHPQVQIVGLDLSFAMLERARRKLPAAARVSWSNAQAEYLPFAEETFCAVVCANSFHYYRRPLKVLEEFRRVLRPGGCLVLADWCSDFPMCRLAHRFLSVVDRAHFHTYSRRQCEELLQRTGFRIESGRSLNIDWRWGVMIYQARA